MLIRDVRGRSFDTARQPQRIVSLVPSLTETLFAYGAGERVVGVTDYCIHPADGVAAKTRVGGTKNPRVERILALAPDLVLANIEENRKPDIETLEAHGVPVYVAFPRTVRMALDELLGLAKLIGVENAPALIEPIQRRLAGLKPPQRRPRVFVAIWRDPWMTANGDTFVGDLIETCGGDNIFRERQRKFPLAADLAHPQTSTSLISRSNRSNSSLSQRQLLLRSAEDALGQIPERRVEGADTRYPRVSLQEVASLQPDVVLLPDEPYRFTERDVRELHATPGLERARVHLLDGTFVTWSGIRMGRALEVLPGLLVP